MSLERARVAYDTYRGSFRGAGNCPVPHWDEAQSWVRDLVHVAYMQGKLDARAGIGGVQEIGG